MNTKELYRLLNTLSDLIVVEHALGTTLADMKKKYPDSEIADLLFAQEEIMSVTKRIRLQYESYFSQF